MKSELRSYSSPFNLGHKALVNLWQGVVVAQEKVDGSQFSFGTRDGELFCRSRRVAIDLKDPGMFDKAVETVQGLSMHDGWIYRAEYLRTKKHNTLTYGRVPNGNLILFDIDRGDQDYMDWEAMREEAKSIGLEVVPQLAVFEQKPTAEDLRALCDTESTLGGVKIEGIVLKNYEQFGQDKKTLMAKYVRPEFVEKHSKDWKKRNPSDKGFVQMLVDEYRTEARWMKAVQHLRELNELEHDPRDIPKVMREIVDDVEQECADEIRDRLFEHFWKDIKRQLNRGAPEWYKALLVEEALSK